MKTAYLVVWGKGRKKLQKLEKKVLTTGFRFGMLIERLTGGQGWKAAVWEEFPGGAEKSA